MSRKEDLEVYSDSNPTKRIWRVKAWYPTESRNGAKTYTDTPPMTFTQAMDFAYRFVNEELPPEAEVDEVVWLKSRKTKSKKVKAK